jgi:hypothetical protein
VNGQLLDYFRLARKNEAAIRAQSRAAVKEDHLENMAGDKLNLQRSQRSALGWCAASASVEFLA